MLWFLSKTIEQRICLKFCVTNEISFTNAFKMLQKAYGDVYELYKVVHDKKYKRLADSFYNHTYIYIHFYILFYNYQCTERARTRSTISKGIQHSVGDKIQHFWSRIKISLALSALDLPNTGHFMIAIVSFATFCESTRFGWFQEIRWERMRNRESTKIDIRVLIVPRRISALFSVLEKLRSQTQYKTTVLVSTTRVTQEIFLRRTDPR